MSEQEESLAGELAPSGSLAWQRLHGEVSSQLLVDLRVPGAEPERVPMALAARARDPSRRRAPARRVRGRARGVANRRGSARGRAQRREGRAGRVEPAARLHRRSRAGIAREQRRPRHARRDDRRGGRVVARLSAVPARQGAAARSRRRAAVVGSLRAGRSRRDDSVVGRDRPRARRVRRRTPTISRRSPNRAFAEHWVDAETRDGKQGGAYCAGVEGDVSRIMMNFDGSQDSISTLAHELGHAFHNVTLAERTQLQRRLPMALAETASIFCETLLFEHAAQQATDDAERLALLDVHLVGATQTVVDIHSRFLFETELCARRRRTTLSVGRHEGGDARRAGGGVRQRSRPRPSPRVHVGGEGPLLHAVLQLAVHVRIAVRHRAVRPVTSTIPSGSAPVTTICSRPWAWPTRRHSPAASGSTSANATSGPTASRCWAGTSTTTSGSPVPDPRSRCQAPRIADLTVRGILVRGRRQDARSRGCRRGARCRECGGRVRARRGRAGVDAGRYRARAPPTGTSPRSRARPPPMCIAVGTLDLPHAVSRLAERWDGTKWIGAHHAQPDRRDLEPAHGREVHEHHELHRGRPVQHARRDHQDVDHALGRQAVDDPPQPERPGVARERALRCSRAAARRNCFAVGGYFVSTMDDSGERTLVEQWNGTTWSIVPSPNQPLTVDSVLDGVTCTSTTNCFAVGQLRHAVGDEHADRALGRQRPGRSCRARTRRAPPTASSRACRARARRTASRSASATPR